ncbi:MAG: glycosyltransferase family 2 protein, partial [Acidimicrobiales bacterium]
MTVDAGPSADSAAGRAATPSVLALVVAHAPGDHFEETLESLGSQDYPRLSVVVIDAAGDESLDERVAGVLPEASVIDASDTHGFSAAANTLLDAALGAAFVLVCHDDVALAPDAVRVMVVEALRSNAGVVGPKLVDWHDPSRLQHVGLVVDRLGMSADLVDPGELDQEQHDRVRDVFAVPSACLLIRGDLFQLLEGFDPVMSFRGEEVDLCWRAQLAGARVVVVPDAVVRHREDLVARRGVDDVRRTRSRHSLRAMLVNHGPISLLIFLPVAAVAALAEVIVALVTGRVGQVRDVAGAWVWNVGRMGSVWQRRRRNRAVRRVRPADVTALQQLASVRMSAFLRGQIGRGGADRGLLGAGRGIVESWRTGTTRVMVTWWVLVLGYLVYGSRTLITDGVPALGDLAAFPDSAGDLLDGWWSGWYDRDLGSAGSQPAGAGVLGLLAWLLGGATGLARTLGVLAPILVGLAGIWRVLAVTGSRRSQIAAMIAYALVPLPYASLASGSMAGLVGYGAAPWLMVALLRSAAAPPFRTSSGPTWSIWSSALGLGAAVGVAVAFEPATVGLVPMILVGLLVGGFLGGRPQGGLRSLVAVVIAAPVVTLAALPLVLDMVAEPRWAPMADGRDGAAGSLGLGELLRFALGPDDPGMLVWGLGVAAAVALIVGRGWRFELAVRCWAVAMVSFGVAYAAQWGLVPFGLPDPHLLVAPAAAATAIAAGLAVTAMEHDLRFARFGWRQALAPLALAGALAASVPAVGWLVDGRWGLARGDYENILAFGEATEGSSRVLWIGAPEFLPVSGVALEGGMAWAATLDGAPTILDHPLPAVRGRADLIGEVLDEALSRRTARLGRQLAGLGIRFVVLLDRLAPAPFSSPDDAVPVPDGIADAFAEQLDLARVDANSATTVYVNTSWVPVRAALPPGFDDGVGEVSDLQASPLMNGEGVLAGRGTELAGLIPDGAEVYVAQTPDPGWTMELDGTVVARRRAVGWASSYLTSGGGEAVLRYRVPW